MKKYFISITVALIATTALFAQNQPRREMKKGWSDQLQSEKIAFFTAEMQLNPQEAASFWPVYNQYWSERQSAHLNIQNSLLKITAAVNSDRHNSEQLKKMTRDYMESLAAESAIYKKYYEKFSSILSPEKVAKIYISEDKFRMKMISRLRQGDRSPSKSANPR
jgi:hypothetical protein